MLGKTDDLGHTSSSVIPGMAGGFRKGMIERVDLQSSYRRISQKGKAAGGTAASETSALPRVRVECFISVRRLLL